MTTTRLYPATGNITTHIGIHPTMLLTDAQHTHVHVIPLETYMTQQIKTKPALTQLSPTNPVGNTIHAQ